VVFFCFDGVKEAEEFLGATRTHYLSLTVVAFLLGLFAVLAYRTDIGVSAPLAGEDRHAQLVQVAADIELNKRALEETILDLRRQVSELERRSADTEGLASSYSSQLDHLSMLAGLVPVTGNGVVVTLADNPSPPEDGADPNNYIIHDYDIRAVVNALYAGGAEAIAVSQQRLVQSSAIRCVGTTVLVNNTRVGSPFVIMALGDGKALAAALQKDADALLLITQYARTFGLKVSIKQAGDVRLPAYGGSVTPRELKPTGKAAS
jgi:uncharacterized protein YlxW (UPF0749 family)